MDGLVLLATAQLSPNTRVFLVALLYTDDTKREMSDLHARNPKWRKVKRTFSGCTSLGSNTPKMKQVNEKARVPRVHVSVSFGYATKIRQ